MLKNARRSEKGEAPSGLITSTFLQSKRNLFIILSIIFSVDHLMPPGGYCGSEGCNKASGKRDMGVPQDVYRPVSTHEMPENAKTAERKGRSMNLRTLFIIFSVMFCLELMVAHAMDCSGGYCKGKEGNNKGGKRAAERKGEATLMKLLTPPFSTSLYCPGLYTSIV